MMNEADKRAINNDYQPCGYVLRLSYDAFFPQSYHLIYLFLSSMLSAVHYLESQSLFESWLSLINWISVFCTFVMWLIWWCGSVANLTSDISRRQVLLFSFPHLSHLTIYLYDMHTGYRSWDLGTLDCTGTTYLHPPSFLSLLTTTFSFLFLVSSSLSFFLFCFLHFIIAVVAFHTYPITPCSMMKLDSYKTEHMTLKS